MTSGEQATTAIGHRTMGTPASQGREAATGRGDRPCPGPGTAVTLVVEVNLAMFRRVDRAVVVIVTALVGLTALVPGWTMITSGTVGGYRLPTDWFSSYSPFSDYLVPGLILLVVIGLGGVVTAAVNLVNADLGAVAALAYGAILVGWIVGELVFMTQTMVLTWVILAAGLVLVALALPGLLPALRERARRRGGQPAG